MILSRDWIRQSMNANLAEVYLAHRLDGKTFRELAETMKVDHSTIFDRWVRACGHVRLELERELARSEYKLRRNRTAQTPDGVNIPELIFYSNGQTHRNTMTIPAIRPFVLAHCTGKVLDVFAGKTRLEREGCEFVTNDISEDCATNYHVDASSETFVKTLNSDGHFSFDTIILDPPFSLYQSKRRYRGEWYRDYTLVKNNVDRLTKLNTKIISFGFNSTGMGRRRGYRKEELLVVNNKGNNNDTLILVERKVKIVETGEEYDYEQVA